MTEVEVEVEGGDRNKVTEKGTETESGDEEGPILGYLKSLPPPAVDLEFRALCTHESDEEGTRIFFTDEKLENFYDFMPIVVYPRAIKKKKKFS